MPEHVEYSKNFLPRLGLAFLKNGIRFTGKDVDDGAIDASLATDRITPFIALAKLFGADGRDIDFYLKNGIPQETSPQTDGPKELPQG